MAAASPWTHDHVSAAFRYMPDLKSLLLTDVVDTGEMVGEGSYGVVRKLRVAGATFCAGKMIHKMLLDRNDRGAKDVVVNFLKECKMMADLRHPHIVQFMGVCLLQGSKMPTLVTELLTDCLHNFIETRPNLPMGVRQSFLTDVASGLVFLHSRTPQIIHRDLTAKNVLVDERSMKAKVGDLGNSRFTAGATALMTRQPGNLLYMAPEALEPNPNYCEKLDIFSFGHLSLYTLTQVFPAQLLAPTAPSPNGDKLIPRSEVERRAQYIEILQEALSKEQHSLVAMIKLCLSNDPRKRPNAMKVLQRLKDLNSDYDDIQPYQQRYSMLLELNQKEKEIKNLQQQLELQVPDADTVKGGPLEKLSVRNIIRRWKMQTFHLTDTHLRFCNPGEERPRGGILLSNVDQVFIPHHSGRPSEKHCFEVHFSGGRDSPWILSASCVEDRKSWMKAIRRQINKNAAAHAAVPPTTRMKCPGVHHYEPISDLLLAPVPPPPTTEKPTLPHRPPDLKRSPAKGGASKPTKAENNAPRGPLPGEPSSDDNLTPSTFEKVYDSLNRRANNFTPNQISFLVNMLQQTQEAAGITEGDEDKGNEKGPHKHSDRDRDLPPDSTYVYPILNYEETRVVEREEAVKEIKAGTKYPYYVNCQDMYERGRPCSTKNRQGSGYRPRSVSPRARDTLYVPYSDLLAPQSQGRSQSSEDLRGEGTPGGNGQPSILPQSHYPDPYLKPVPHRKQQETLRTMLNLSKQTSENLLITEDDSPDEYILRPQWAKASTVRPGPRTLAALHQSRGINISPRTLTKVSKLGEGRFGTVWKAELVSKNKAKVAVKSLARIAEDFREEVTIMSDVVHPNIVRLYGLINYGEMAPALVMEYLCNRDLKTFLSRNSSSKPQLMKYMVDVAMGMHYLSERGIIHRDLAARNVLVDKNELCKVADFGVLREVPHELHELDSRGPPQIRWMAPEIITKRTFSPASDIWSFGILQWEMFNPHKLYPYPTLRNEEVVGKVTSGYSMATPRNAPQVVVRVMKACWNSQPSRRPSFLLIANLLTSHMIGND